MKGMEIGWKKFKSRKESFFRPLCNYCFVRQLEQIHLEPGFYAHTVPASRFMEPSAQAREARLVAGDYAPNRTERASRCGAPRSVQKEMEFRHGIVTYVLGFVPRM